MGMHLGPVGRYAAPRGVTLVGRLGSNRPIAGSLILLLLLGLLSLTNTVPAFAAATYQITGKWASNTPAQVAPGAVVTAEWRINVNDDAAAPSNAPVDNVTVTLTAMQGKFASIPDVCKTTGVTPPSSISADDKTLVCNLGTQNMGTAIAIQMPIISDGVTGDRLSVSGSIGGATASLAAVPIVGKFGMDMKWSESGNWTLADANFVHVDYEWTLNLLKGSPAGPNSVSYTITMNSSLGGAVISEGCGQFTSDTRAGHPWSGGGHPADQTAPFVGSCTLTATATPNVYTMTLTGINYSQTQVPTKDAAGNNLPTDRVAVASGRIQFRIAKPAGGVTVNLSSNAPTYTSAVGGLTSADDAANNTSGKFWTTTGGWGSAWVPTYSGSPAASYADTFRAPAGTEIWKRQATALHQGQLASTVIQLCTALDAADVTLSSTPIQTYLLKQPSTLTPAQNIDLANNPFAVSPYGPVNGLTYYYYVGNDPRVTAGSAGYNPAAFTATCNTDAANWTTTRPADLSTVKAIRTEYAAGSVPSDHVFFVHVPVTINADTAPGTDIWQASSFRVGAAAWTTVGGNLLTATPGSQYPSTTAFLDVMRVVSVSPYMEKSVDRASVKPGEPAVYTIGYAANGGSAAPPTVDGFVITDTLPVGMSYVAGSASPEPVVTTNGSGQQVLTWTFNGVTTNVLHPLTYQAVAGANATAGQTLTNGVTGSVAGQTTTAATADVTVSTNGATTIGKIADTAFIPNVAGDGSGAGSWTVMLRSFDPTPQSFTDTIDILPYNGDGRGTSFTGSYALTGVTAVAGATVYYTTADPASLSDDPAAAANGSAGSVSGNTVGWTTTKPAKPTAVRVIGPALAPGATQAFMVAIQTTGATGGDVLVNKAQARDQHTELGMLTSAPITVAKHYTASLKKEVKDLNGIWHDANDVVDYPTFRTGDTVPYRITVRNMGQGTLTNIKVADDNFPAEGGFTIASLDPGASQTHEFSITLGAGVSSTLVNTASASADIPSDSQIPPSINIDPAGIEVANYTTVKTSVPASGATVTSGQKVTYTVTVTQKGSAPANASFTDDLTAVLDDANYNTDAAASTGTVTVAGSGLSWNGTVPVGGTASITYSVTVKTALTGDLVLTNVVTSDGCVPVNGQTPDCTTTHRVPNVGPIVTCASDGDIFNTGYNAATGGVLADNAKDANWRVAGPFPAGSAASLPPANASFAPANVGNLVPQPAGWKHPANGDVQWISQQTTTNSTSGQGDWYYRYTFTLDPNVDPSAFTLAMDFMADNAVQRVWVNGVDQNGQTTGLPSSGTNNPYTFPGYGPGTEAHTTLNHDWKAGINTILVAIASNPAQEGFLAEFTDTSVCAKQTVLIEKIGESSESTWVPMAGSTWAIHDDANGTPGDVNAAYTVEAIPNQTGRFQVQGVAPGEYWLEETTAPDGFNLLAEPVQFTVAANGVITVGEGSGGGVVTAADDDGDGIFLVTVRDVPALEMPESGGTGSWPFMAAGAALLLAAFVLASGSMRRRRNQPAA